MLATSPRFITSAWMSGTCKPEKGSPSRAGSSQAIALTTTTSSGGENRAPARAVALLKSGQALLEEALTPLGDDLERQIEPAGDGLVLRFCAVNGVRSTRSGGPGAFLE